MLWRIVMERKRRIMSASNMESWTRASKDRMQRAIDFADRLRTDPEHHNRVQAGLCRMCYYGSHIGGQAITTEPCMCCGKEQTYSSTATDILCRDCAKETGLCKRCGGDREGKIRRKWPSVKDL